MQDFLYTDNADNLGEGEQAQERVKLRGPIHCSRGGGRSRGGQWTDKHTAYRSSKVNQKDNQSIQKKALKSQETNKQKPPKHSVR